MTFPSSSTYLVITHSLLRVIDNMSEKLSSLAQVFVVLVVR